MKAMKGFWSFLSVVAIVLGVYFITAMVMDKQEQKTIEFKMPEIDIKGGENN